VFVPPPSRLALGKLERPLTVPPPDFTRELSRLSGGWLTAEQLASVRESATFAVASDEFPDQVHIWELNSLLQQGRRVACDRLLDGIALSVAFFIEFLPNRLWRRRNTTLNLLDGLSRVVYTLWRLPAVIWGGTCREDVLPNTEDVRMKAR
jgi:hypothetical protein